MAVYQWKVPGVFSVSAQVAGETLERIYQEGGALDPGDVVEESRPEDAPLHPAFEWDDRLAAEEYRKHQARQIIRSVVVVEEREEQPPVEVRAFVHAERKYHPISVAVRSVSMMEDLRHQAVRDMLAFRRKYDALNELSPVLQAIDMVVGECGA